MIAVKNFDENTDEYAQKLIDSYGGTFDYNKNAWRITIHYQENTIAERKKI